MKIIDIQAVVTMQLKIVESPLKLVRVSRMPNGRIAIYLAGDSELITNFPKKYGTFTESLELEAGPLEWKRSYNGKK